MNNYERTINDINISIKNKELDLNGLTKLKEEKCEILEPKKSYRESYYNNECKNISNILWHSLL